MSTPISNIPVQQQPTKIEEDPEVTAMLKEMQPASASPHPQPVPPQPNIVVPPRPPQVIHYKKPYMDYDILYKALYAVAIAYIVFYPEIGFVYSKMPLLENYKTYEFITRVLLFGVIIYMILWKFY